MTTDETATDNISTVGIPSDNGHVVIDGDPWAHETLRDPIPFDTLVREAGPVVRLGRYGIWATGRYEQAEAVLRDWESFPSSFGTGLLNVERQANWRKKSVILDSDPPDHSRTRAVMTRVLSPGAIRKLRQDFAAEADRLVDELVSRREFDAARDLAEAFPLKVLPDSLGMAEEGRQYLLPYANVNFQAMGPRNELYHQAVEQAGNAAEFVAWQMRREALRPDGFGAQIYAAADAGEIDEEEAGLLVRSFLSAGVDTTVFAIGFTVHELAQRPDQWALVRQNPPLVRQAFEETLRFLPPSPFVGRTTAREIEFAGANLGAEEKIILFVAAANRDPRRWENPDTFDLRRRTAGHLAFGTGIHGCVGQIIARLEAESVLTAVARKVAQIHLTGQPQLKLSNWLRGYTSLPVAVDPA